MRTMRDVFQKLRKVNKKNYYLYVGCNFLALLLITAYSAMMFSPTVLEVLPEGGDSRKQMIAIFVMACVGCLVFTVYAGNLFFRMKSKEIGIMMALGAARKKLSKGLFQEVVLLSGISSAAGVVLGFPFSWILWQAFRIFMVDSEEMKLVFDPRGYLVAGIFWLAVIGAAYLIARRFLFRTNIMDVVNEIRKSEPIHDVKAWCGPAGILLLLAGAVAGYSAPGVYMEVAKRLPPVWINLLYIPVFIGIYMILLHTVVRGWHNGKRYPYKGIITKNMMKFQGRQTVNNMLVVTILIAGGCFGVFYIPMLQTSAFRSIDQREYDYFYHYRQDQNIPEGEEVKNLAQKYGVEINDWQEAVSIVMARDGWLETVDDTGKFQEEYQERASEISCISESTFRQITGQDIEVDSGKEQLVLGKDGQGKERVDTSVTQLTNMETGEVYPVEWDGYLYSSLLGLEYAVLDDRDFEEMSKGLSSQWKEYMIFFQVKEDNYQFAQELFDNIVDASGPECAYSSFYDRVRKIENEKKGEVYWGDTEPDAKIDYEKRNGSQFRLNWKYMPKFSILDIQDQVRTMAVFLMMFLFIAIVCFSAALIIAYTRCLTIGINNRQVFEDLKKLGAGPRYLYLSVQGQVSKVFLVPSFVGMGAMYILYFMIMFANDGRLLTDEILGMAACLGVILFIALIVWGVYRYTLKQIVQILEIPRINKNFFTKKG